MPIWGELELFCRAILNKGNAEAEKILAMAHAEAERIISTTKEKVVKELQEQLLDEENKAFIETRRLLDSAELEARKKIVTFREQVVHEIFDILASRLKTFNQRSEYPDFLTAAIKEGINSLPGKEFIIEVRIEDFELVQNKRASFDEQGSLKIDLRASASIEGGSRIYTADERLLYDNSLPARMKRHEDEIRGEIWRRIFGTERSER